MRNSLDISSVLGTIKQDSDDTSAKISELLSSLQKLDDYITFLNDQAGVIQDQKVISDYLYSIFPYDELGQWSNILTTIGDKPMQIRYKPLFSDVVGEPEYIIYGTVLVEVQMYGGALQTYDLYFEYYGQTMGNGYFGPEFKKDGQYIDIPSCFSDIVVDGTSFLSIITNFKDSLATNEFISDLVNCVKVNGSYTSVMTKWLNENNISSSLKETINSALLSIDGSASSIFNWLYGIYDSMKNTTYSDGEYTFSSTNFIVQKAFASVAQTTIQLLTTAIPLIITAISRVAGLIAFAVAGVAQVITTNLANKANPLIQKRDSASLVNDFLPIPVLQASISAGDPGSVSNDSGIDKGTLRLNTFLANFRIFSSDANHSTTKWEAFLRCPISPEPLVKWFYNKVGRQGIWVNDNSSFRGVDEIFYNLTNNNEEVDPYCVTSLPYEENQALFVMLHMILFFVMFGKYATPSSDTTSTCHDAIVNGTATLSQLVKFIKDTADVAAQIYAQGKVLENFYKNSGGLLLLGGNWEFVINHFIPCCRSYMSLNQLGTIDPSLHLAWSGDYISANNYFEVSYLRPYNENYTTTWVEDVINQTDSPFTIPKYTGSGFIRNLVLAVVLTAAIVATALVVRAKAKAYTRKIAYKKVQNLDQLKKFNDAVQSDPSYSKADKQAAWKMYDKAVRSYNRTSWLWGGGTWSTTNGWVDYASNPSSTASFTESIISSYNDKVMTVDNANVPNRVMDNNVSLMDLKTLITGE